MIIDFNEQSLLDQLDNLTIMEKLKLLKAEDMEPLPYNMAKTVSRIIFPECRFNINRNKWMYFNGTIWVEDSTETYVNAKIKEVIEAVWNYLKAVPGNQIEELMDWVSRLFMTKGAFPFMNK